MNEKDKEIEIDLRVILGLLWENVLIIIISMIFCGALTFLITKFFMTPMYSSTTSMTVQSNENNNNNGNVSVGDVQVATMLINDYMEIVKSKSVLRAVIDELDLNMSASQLSKRVAVSTPNNSRILKITATDENPITAKKIADAIAKYSGQFIYEKMNTKKVSVIDEAEVATSPSSPRVVRNVAIGVILGMIVPIAVIVLMFIFDDTIKDKEDVEKYIGLPVLAAIPYTDKMDDSIETRARKKVSERRDKSKDRK
ncbi:MAG TPA: protein-tyrosine kinase [Eubacterium sp.]|nr:protein-tyrosine kinase [Eubacterium sp.]HBZ53688.1 protein-tyrosine kinase [Eubacterium sp.]